MRPRSPEPLWMISDVAAAAETGVRCAVSQRLELKATLGKEPLHPFENQVSVAETRDAEALEVLVAHLDENLTIDVILRH